MIIRDIPEDYYLYNSRIHTFITVLGVTRNGEPENYWIEKRGTTAEIFTGAKNNHSLNYIPKGSNIYKIHWTSPNHIRGFMDYDELYFNAIGNSWEFPIEKASVTLHLPDSVKEIQSAGYYGKTGSTQKANVNVISPQIIEFTAPSPIGNRKGLTIATGFTKGVVSAVEAPYLAQVIEKILSYLPSFVQFEHVIFGAIIIVLFVYGLVGLMLYNLLKPNSKRAFMVRFSPPDLRLDQVLAFSNPSMYKGEDRQRLSLFMDLVQKAIIIFKKPAMQFVIDKRKEVGFKTRLAPSQRQFLLTLHQLLDGKVFYHQYNPIFAKAFYELTRSVNDAIDEYYYSVIPFFKTIGFLLFIACIIYFSEVFNADTAGILVFIAVGCAILYITIVIFFKCLTASNVIPKFLMSLFFLFFGLVFTVIPLPILWNLNDDNYVLASLLLVLQFFMFFSLFFLYGKVTKVIKPEYMEDQQQVLEFKHFLQYTKEDEYKIISPDMFEEYLPYAIGFGVDESWLKRYQLLYPEHYENSLKVGEVSVRSIVKSESFNKASTVGRSGGRGGGRGGSGSGSGGSSGGGSGGGGGRGR